MVIGVLMQYVRPQIAAGVWAVVVKKTRGVRVPGACSVRSCNGLVPAGPVLVTMSKMN